MDRDTLAIVERIIKAEGNRNMEKCIGSAISYVLWYAIADRYTHPSELSRDILLKFLCFECYEAYKHAAYEVIDKFKDSWHDLGIFHPKSTRQILAFPFELTDIAVVPFIRFLYEFTDEPWRVYEKLEDIFYDE